MNLYESGLENFFDNLNDSSITTSGSRLPNLSSFIAKYIIDLSSRFISLSWIYILSEIVLLFEMNLFYSVSK